MRAGSRVFPVSESTLQACSFVEPPCFQSEQCMLQCQRNVLRRIRWESTTPKTHGNETRDNAADTARDIEIQCLGMLFGNGRECMITARAGGTNIMSRFM